MLLLAICLFSSVISAFPIEVNESVDIYQEANFEVKITNMSSTPKEITVNFFAPTDVTVFAPRTIPPNSTVTAKVFVKDSFEKYTEIQSTLEVVIGNEIEQRTVLLKFYESQDAFQNATGDFTAALFGLPLLIGGMTAFTTLEWLAIFILVLVAAALLVAFVVRVARRV
jgi:hypothetical protein